MNITLPKNELLEKLVENRRQHSEVYALAAAGYQKAMVKELTDRLADAVAGKDVNRYLQLGVDKPKNHISDYDQAIAMIEMTSGLASLDSKDFAHFILDEWGWKEEFRIGLSSGKLCINEGDLAGYSNYS